MSTPIKDCIPLLEKLVFYQGLHNAPVIPKLRLYITVAGLVLAEEGRRSFSKDDIKEKLQELGYDPRTYNHPGTYSQQFTALTREQIFIQTKGGKYRFNKKALKQN